MAININELTDERKCLLIEENQKLKIQPTGTKTEVPQMTQENNQIDMQEMTDYQKLQMTQVSYLDFDMEETERLKGMKLADAKQYLANPDTWAMGLQFDANAESWKNQAANAILKNTLGQDYATDQDLYQQCVDAGFGELRIKDVVSDKETGFQALALEDQEGNVYFSFRGSDGDFSRGMQHDWMDANLKEFFLGDEGTQQQQAVEFFDRNKSETGQNAVFGHSLGGNLTSHVFAQREGEISQAFCYNANPISQRYLDTPEKKQAFQSERFTFAITEGDAVSGFKGHESYENRTVYIQNNKEDANMLYSHMAHAASFNQDGSFALSTQEEHIAQRDSSKAVAAVLSMTHNLDTIMQNREELAECLAQVFQGQWPDNLKETIQEISPEAAEWIGRVYDEFFDGQGLEMATPQELSQSFGVKMQAPQQDVAYVTPEQLMAMTNGMTAAVTNPEQMMSADGIMQVVNNMEQAGPGMDGFDAFTDPEITAFMDQTIQNFGNFVVNTDQIMGDGLPSWGENTANDQEIDSEIEQEEDFDQEDARGFKFCGQEL